MGIEKYILTAGLAIGSILYTGCGSSTPTEPQHPHAEPGECLRCDDTIQFNSNAKGIGRFLLDMHDAKWLAEECDGFQFYGGHKGGTGDTLEIIGCDNGVYFVWAFNLLFQIDVTQGWTGTTERGVALGDSREQVQAAYPDAAPCDADSIKVTSGSDAMVFDFDTNGELERIVMGFDAGSEPCLLRIKD